MTTFEEADRDRGWLAGWSFQSGELYQAIESVSAVGVDIEEVLSLALAFLMERWEPEASERRITQLLWTAARDAARDVRAGLQWEPVPGGYKRARPKRPDTVSIHDLEDREDEFETGPSYDPWPTVEDRWDGYLDDDEIPWWMRRVQEEVDALTPEARGDAFRMMVDGLPAFEIAELVGEERTQIVDWNKRTPGLLANRLRDVEEGLGLRDKENYGFPLSWGMTRVPLREGRQDICDVKERNVGGFMSGHDARAGITELRLKELIDRGEN